MEGGGLGEGVEVAVAGDERNAGVQVVLCNQGIGEAGFPILREHSCAQSAGPLPKTGFDLEQCTSARFRQQGRAEVLGRSGVRCAQAARLLWVEMG